MTYSLKNNWVVDSGANVHICNQRERFIDLRKDSAEITLGDGHSISQGCGTARIIVRNPDSGKIQWATLTDVWYALDFATNIISVSEIKKKGFFFTSELPGIVSAIGPIARCQEKYGLYLLENGDTEPPLLSHPVALASLKTSEKPVVSSASPEIWHRRLGHTYARRIETLAKMVDGVYFRGGTFEAIPEICETCQLNDAKRQISRRPANRSRVFGRFGRIHFDMVQLDEAYNGDNWVTHLYIEGIRFHLLQTHERKNGCVNAII